MGSVDHHPLKGRCPHRAVVFVFFSKVHSFPSSHGALLARASWVGGIDIHSRGLTPIAPDIAPYESLWSLAAPPSTSSRSLSTILPSSALDARVLLVLGDGSGAMNSKAGFVLFNPQLRFLHNQ